MNDAEEARLKATIKRAELAIERAKGVIARGKTRIHKATVKIAALKGGNAD